MEYERMRKVQIGMLSPSKLRMKLLGPRDGTMKGESNSSKMLLVKNEDMKRARSRLLSSDVEEEEISKNIKGALTPDVDLVYESFGGEVPEKEPSSFSDCINQSRSDEKIDINCLGSIPHHDHSNSKLSIIHPVRNLEEGGSNSHDSGNDAACSFEFYHADRSIKLSSVGLFNRHIPSKWNDAEKWIANRQVMNPSVKLKAVLQNHQTRIYTADSMIAEHKFSRTEFNQNSSQDIVEKFSFDPHGSNCKLVKSVNPATYSANSGSSARPGDGVNCQRLSRRFACEPTAVAATEFVSMRDIGTEMTPVPTPLGSVTPTRSSLSSVPSTPRQGEAVSLPNEDTKNREQDSETKGSEGPLREREMRVKITSDIAALGLQLGKKNIASWARKELEQRDSESCAAGADPTKSDYESCATAWEEAENTKHMARYKREQVKIQAWENHQKAKLEAKMKKIEAKAEEVLVCATEKMAEKLAMTLQRVKEKQAAAEARLNKKAARISHMAEMMRKTGQIPQRNYLCCSVFF